jgi:hypothetical protein
MRPSLGRLGRDRVRECRVMSLVDGPARPIRWCRAVVESRVRAGDHVTGEGRPADRFRSRIDPCPGWRSSSSGRLTMWLDRRNECAVLDQLLQGARDGRSAALVVRGAPGVGKTALLEYAIQSASDLRVVHAVGAESEMELAFAALHQLCIPMLDRLNRLPSHSATRSGRRSGWPQGMLPIVSSWGWQPSACSRSSLRIARCCASWTTRSGWTAHRR